MSSLGLLNQRGKTSGIMDRKIGKNLAVSYRHTFTPNLVNEFTTGFNRFAFVFTFGESISP